jgi:uncharacterized protein (DUF433 family)
VSTSGHGTDVGDPEVRIYLFSEVARYTRLRPSTARYSHRRLGDGLSFLDLVSLLIMRELRRSGVSSRAVRHAESYLTSELGPYPFARGVMWTDGAHVLFNPDSPLSAEMPNYQLTSADKSGQRAFVEALRQYLHSIRYSDDDQGVAVAWYPNERVELNPSRQFGQPCLRGTRISTRALYLLHTAGDADETLVNSFGISRVDLAAALRWEKDLLQKVA